MFVLKIHLFSLYIFIYMYIHIAWYLYRILSGPATEQGEASSGLPTGLVCPEKDVNS